MKLHAYKGRAGSPNTPLPPNGNPYGMSMKFPASPSQPGALGDRSLPNCGRTAFTLLEMIGVLAIILFLLAALLPAWIRRIDLAVRKAEVSNLVTISNALTHQVLRGATFHTATTWTQSVADWTMIPISKVHANVRGYPRIYYFEEGGTPRADWVQTFNGLTNPPSNLRAMIISTLGGDTLSGANWYFPQSCELPASYFNALWTLQDNSRPPTGAWENWNGRADDLLIQRINYAPLFHHLVLVNRDTNQVPVFAINGSATNGVFKTSFNDGWGRYYLDGTVVDLGDPQGNLLTSYVLDRDISFVWEAGKWRAEIIGAADPSSTGDDFNQKAAEFLATLRYDKAFKGADQQGVVTAMYSFMLTYVFWAEKCPRFPTYGIERVNVPEYKILRNIGVRNGRLDVFSRDLVSK